MKINSLAFLNAKALNENLVPAYSSSKIGLFETLRFSNNRINNFDDHFERIFSGCQILHLSLPSKTEIFDRINSIVEQSGFKNCRLRYSVFYSVNPDSEELIEIFETGEPSKELLTINNAGIFRELNIYPNKLSKLKTTNRLIYSAAQNWAFQHNFSEAVMVNNSGNICETTIANIFIVKDEVIYTPTAEDGCIEGIMKKNLLAYFKNHNYSFFEKSISEQELLQADEVFVSNSIINIKSINKIGNKKYSNNFTERLYQNILNTSDLFY